MAKIKNIETGQYVATITYTDNPEEAGEFENLEIETPPAANGPGGSTNPPPDGLPPHP